MANIFNSVKGLHPRRNSFSADTYRNDFTAPLGSNIPVYLQEVPPATKVRLNAYSIVRLQALISPIMDNIDYYVHFWKLPYRLIENDRFTAFISGEIESNDYDALFATPYELAVAIQDYLNDNQGGARDYDQIVGNGSLLDFLGYDKKLFPQWNPDTGQLVGGNKTTKLNWRGLIAYYMLHVNWYMNENVPYYEDFVSDVDELVKEQSLEALAKLLVEGGRVFDQAVTFTFLPHGWPKDYFTSALPNVQYGDPVTIPSVSGYAPVDFDPNVEGGLNLQIADPYVVSQESLFEGTDANLIAWNQGESSSYKADIGVAGVDNAQVQSLSGEVIKRVSGSLGLRADLSEASAISINELRFANALQVFKERQLRFGRRRLEYYKGFFDVSPEDLRLQVPKYLGGGRIPINISDIEQTSATSEDGALGHLAGKGTAVSAGFAGFTTFCSEESVLIGIAFAMPKVTYANVISRFKLKTNDPYDYFNPSFEHLGEQAIKKIEVYTGSNDPDGDFGYTPRYNEYRFHLNEMHGAFKDSLAFWTLGRIFSGQPALNPYFIYMQPAAFDRIFAVSGQPNMLVSMIFHQQTIKPVSKYGTPMLLA